MNRFSLIIKDIGRTNYEYAYEIQKDIVNRKINDIDSNEYIIFTEHNPVITFSKKSNLKNIKVNKNRLAEENISLKKVNRGGNVTYHGPGQLVGYIIFDLNKYKKDLKWLLRKYEQVFINLLNKEFNLNAHRVKQHTGVWVNDRKITAIGIGVRKWITFHGFAFNINPCMKHFNYIVPCGIENKGVTSLQQEIGYEDRKVIKNLLAKYFKEEFNLEKGVTYEK